MVWYPVSSGPALGPVHPIFRKVASIVSRVVDCVWNVMAYAQKPDFVFRRNGRVPLNRRGVSVQSTTGSRGVRISGSNAGYTMFRGNVKSTGYPIHSPVSLHIPSCASPCAVTFQLDSSTDHTSQSSVDQESLRYVWTVPVLCMACWWMLITGAALHLPPISPFRPRYFLNTLRFEFLIYSPSQK
jgi:hypothetical protein